MFGFVENKRKWIQIGLILVSLPFVGTGMMGYMNNPSGGGQQLVQINGGNDIQEEGFERRWMEYKQQTNIDPAKLTQQKQDLLNKMIDDELFRLYASQQHFSVSDKLVRDRIAQEPSFQGEDGRFSLEKYQQTLKQIGQSEAQFENMVQSMLVLLPLEEFMKSWLSTSLIDYYINVFGLQHVIRTATLSSESFAKNNSIDAASAQTYYKNHADQYKEPEKIQIESIDASPEAAEQQVVVTEEVLRKYYEEHKTDYVSNESRHVKHILLKVEPNTAASVKASKKAQMEKWLQELKAHPEQFASYAKQHSEDPGSAEQGGDLGEVKRGAMVKPFEDAVFGVSAAHTLTGPVETQFGYHLILVEDIHPAAVRPFETVKEDIEKSIRQEQGRARQEAWTHQLDQGSDNLDAISKATSLPVKRSDWLDKVALTKLLEGKQGVADLLFENAQKKENHILPTQELSGGQRLFIVRPVAYQAPRLPSFEEIKPKVIADLQREKGLIQAREEGKKLLASLEKKEKLTNTLTWSAPNTITYQTVNQISPTIKNQVLQARPKGAPVYIGENSPEGYRIIAVDAVIPAVVDDTKRAQLRPAFQQMWAAHSKKAFASALRKLYKVKINQERWKNILKANEAG